MGAFLIVCGGTGGHLSPGIALAERLAAKGHDCPMMISSKSVDSRLCRKYTAFRFIPMPGVPLIKSPMGILRFGIHHTRAFFLSLKHIRTLKPEAVITFGGFLSLPVVMAAFLLRKPVVLHEANMKAGRATRMLWRFASRVYLPEGVTLRGLRNTRIRHYGFPVRREIHRMGRQAARLKLGLEAHGKVLAVLGGSQGAESLNEWIRTHLEELARDNVQIYCLTGLGKGAQGSVEMRNARGELIRAYFYPFSDDMSAVLSAADLVISRAGAGSIAELIQCLTPSILIPYPYAADRHQHANALYLERAGGCVVVDQKALDGLHREVNEILFNDWLLARLRQNLRGLRRGDAGERIARDLVSLTTQDGTANSEFVTPQHAG